MTFYWRILETIHRLEMVYNTHTPRSDRVSYKFWTYFVGMFPWFWHIFYNTIIGQKWIFPVSCLQHMQVWSRFRRPKTLYSDKKITHLVYGNSLKGQNSLTCIFLTFKYFVSNIKIPVLKFIYSFTFIT